LRRLRRAAPAPDNRGKQRRADSQQPLNHPAVLGEAPVSQRRERSQLEQERRPSFA
jgi:hypothetical protein